MEKKMQSGMHVSTSTLGTIFNNISTEASPATLCVTIKMSGRQSESPVCPINKSESHYNLLILLSDKMNMKAVHSIFYRLLIDISKSDFQIHEDSVLHR